MKIAFLVASRGFPRRAAAVIESAKALESGKHQVAYVVGCDSDDVDTYNFFKTQYPGLDLSVDARPRGVGAVWNRCAARVPDADVYVPFVDDGFVGTPQWDGLIEQVLEAFPSKELGVFAWNDLANPNQCSLPIITKEWHALAGLYDDRFPFWFYDTCVAEVWSFVTGMSVPVVPELVLTQKKGITRRMRDLSLWWDLYIATRQERLQLAADIRQRLGIELDPAKLARTIMGWAQRDVIGRAGLDATEKNLAEAAGPTPEYIDAKAAAEVYLAMNNFVPFHAEVA